MLVAKRTSPQVMGYAQKTKLARAGQKRPRPTADVRTVGVNLALLILAVFLGLFVTSRYTVMAEMGYRLAEMEEAVAALQEENRRLKLEVARLEAPERIERVARERLGMYRPNEVRYYAATGIGSENSLPRDNPAEQEVRGYSSLIKKVSHLAASLFGGGGRVEASEK